MRVEHCVYCDEETGKAGRGEDSNYTEEGKGPFCDGCFAELREERIRAAELAVLEAAEISSRAHAVAWELKGGCCCPLCNAVRNLKSARGEL